MDTKFEKLLNSYNKDISGIKRKLLETTELSDFKDLLKTLDFEIDNKSDKFRWAQRYFLEIQEKMSWRTVAPGELKRMFRYNKETKRQDVIYDTPFYSSKDLTNHYRSGLGNRRKLNYKIPEGYDIASYNIQKINNKTFGAVQRDNSNVLWLDIDNRDDRKATRELMKFMREFNILPKNIFYAEQNVFTGGIHAFIGLSKIINNKDFYSRLENYCKSKGIHIECNFQNKVLRLPLSYEYVPFRLSARTTLNREFISPKYYINNLNDLYSTYVFEPADIKNFDFLLVDNYVPIIFEQQIKEDNKYNNYWNTKRCLFKRDTNNNLKSYHINPITKGNRFEQTKKLVPFLKSQGYSLYDTARIIKENNYDSKDLTIWSIEDVQKQISSFYNKCPDSKYKKIKSIDCPFISNELLLDDRIKSTITNPLFINLFANKLMNNYLTIRNNSHSFQKKMTENKLNILKKQLPYILTEVIAKMIYDIQTNKTFIKKELERINGFQLSDAFVKKLLEYVNNKLGLTGRISNWNIQFFKKALIKSLNLKEVLGDNVKRKWIKGSCISYCINTLKEIYSLVKELVVLNKSFNQFIYNISIGNHQENESLIQKNDYLMNYSTIPIPI